VGIEGRDREAHRLAETAVADHGRPKDSVNSWPFDTDPEWSPCPGWNPVTLAPHLRRGARLGVWQALATHGGEVISTGADRARGPARPLWESAGPGIARAGPAAPALIVSTR
jgi:hypothetical protein